MAALLVVVVVSVCVETWVMAASTPVSVHHGDNAIFSWPLPASARGKLVQVVSPGGQPVLVWGPDCGLFPSVHYADRVHTSCQDDSQVTFTLLRVTWPDEGSYTCRDVASSEPRIENCGQTLTVFKDHPFPQPQISYSGIPVLGQPYSMSCECLHHCPLSAHILHSQWFKNSVLLPETSFVFSVPRVREEDTGTYTCTIIGSTPETTSPASPPYTWVAMVPPQVHIELNIPDADVKETIGKTLTLTCMVTKAFPKVPMDGYSWSYLPSPQGQLRPLVGKTSTLTLGPLTREDSGQYFCLATNDQISEKTYIPPGNASFTLSTSCIDVLLDVVSPSRALLERDGDGYRALIEVPWYDGLILIQHPNSYIIADWHPPCNFDVTEAFQHRVTNLTCDPCKRTLSFTLAKATERDLGRYQCYAGTTHGARIDSCTVELISKAPTQLYIKPITADTVVKVITGNNLTLTCMVTEANPEVPADGYSWSYLPSPQRQLRPLVGKTRGLTLGPVTREDSGQYFCQANNDPDNRWKLPPGNASVTVGVSYMGGIVSTSDLKVKKGDHVTLTCIVDSKPEARLVWVVEGQEVRHVTANENHYVLMNATCSDSNTYTCRASNPDLPDLEHIASVTLTVNCGQVGVPSEHNVWQTVAIALVVLVFVLGIVVVVLSVWHKPQRRKRVALESHELPFLRSRDPSYPSIREGDNISASYSCSSGRPLHL